MTLKEKFKQWLDTEPRVQIREVPLEIIADEFAIDFVEWIYRNNHPIAFYFKQDITKDLLEIYKKESNL